MALGFGATYGTAISDIVTSALVAASPTTRTWHLKWSSDAGTAAFSRVVIRDNAGTEETSFVIVDGPTVATPVLSFRQRWTGGLAEWTWTTPTEGSLTWHATTITYDIGSTSNDPTVYHDGAILTVGSGLTEAVAPSGTVTNNAVALLLGNRAAADRNHYGAIAEFAEWDRILSVGEIAALHKGWTPGQFLRGLTEYLPLIRTGRSAKVGAATISGALPQTHARIVQPHGSQRGGAYPRLVVSGTGGSGMTESEVVTGAKTLILTLTGARWRNAG